MRNDAITFVDALINRINKSPYRIDNFHDNIYISDNKELSKVFKIPIEDIFVNKIRNQLMYTVTSYNLSEEEYYKPKLVSEKLYGTTEFWLPLLRLNDMRDLTEFRIPLIRIYSPELFKDLIDILLQKEGRKWDRTFLLQKLMKMQ